MSLEKKVLIFFEIAILSLPFNFLVVYPIIKHFSSIYNFLNICGFTILAELSIYFIALFLSELKTVKCKDGGK
mgnify:CR=1 FL=1